MHVVIAIPMLRALEAGGRLVMGNWSLTGGYGTLPAVINPEWDDMPIWVGSRHVVVMAVKNGLVEAEAAMPTLTTYKITREGSALLRDYKITRKYLRSKDDLPDNRDDDLAVEGEVPPERESVTPLLIDAPPEPAAPPKEPKKSAVEAVGIILREYKGQPLRRVSLENLLAEKFDLKLSEGRIRNAVQELRRMGLWIETDPAFGYRYLGENPGLEHIVRANQMDIGPKPEDPPQHQTRTCPKCCKDQWGGKFTWHKHEGVWRQRRTCRTCYNASQKLRRVAGEE